jgi:hypothetical protein
MERMDFLRRTSAGFVGPGMHDSSVPAENAIGLYSVELVREGSLVFSIVLDLILITFK